MVAARVRWPDKSAVGALGGGRLVRAAVLTWFLAIAFVLLMAGGSALAKRASLQRFVVLGRGVVQPSALAFVTDQCPASHPHPVGPYFAYTRSASVVGSLALTASHPQGERGWFTEVENLTNQTQGLIMGVVCLGADARFAYPRTSNDVGPSGFTDGFADCPRSAPHAIDNYFGVQSAGSAGSILLAETSPFPFGKVDSDGTGVRNLTTQTVGFFAGTVCTSLRSATRYFRDAVAAGKNSGVMASCPRQTPVAVSGTFFPVLPKPHMKSNAGKIAMDFTFPYARNEWSMGVTSLTDHAVKYLVGAVCVGQ
jgi:hypothetical protein